MDSCSDCGSTDQLYSVYKGLKRTTPVRFVCHKCHIAEKLAKWRKTGVFDDKLLIEAVFHEIRGTRQPSPRFVKTLSSGTTWELCALGQRLDGAVKTLERRLWRSGGLYRYMRVAKVRGHRATKGGVKALAWAGIGRVMVTLSKKGWRDNVTVIYDESSKEGRSGLQSVYGTEDRVLDLLSVDFCAKDFQPDTKVSPF